MSDPYGLKEYKLKSCPFCLEDVRIVYDGGCTTYFFIECCGITTAWVTRDELWFSVKQWNKRKEPIKDENKNK